MEFIAVALFDLFSPKPPARSSMLYLLPALITLGKDQIIDLMRLNTIKTFLNIEAAMSIAIDGT